MRFLLVTDSHLAPTAGPCNSNWQAVRRYAASASIDLTIHLGDITFNGVDAPEQQDWALQCCADWPTELRFLPGNHDIGDNPPAPGVAAAQPLDLDRLRQYRAGFGADSWSFAAGAWLVLGLNAQLFGSDTAAEAEQWRWLEAVLAETGRRPVALLLHKPLFLDDPAAATPPHIRYVPVGPRRRLLDLLALVELRLVMSGHTHQYLDRDIGGVRHIWLPSTAFIIPDSKQDRIGEKLTGAGVLELWQDSYRFDLIVPDGMERHGLLDPALAPLIGAY